MCRICNGNPPNLSDFHNFRDHVLEARRNVNSLDDFVKNAIILDKIRFTTGAEWGEPNISRAVIQYIFSNPDPDIGLLLFILCCWLDMQAPYIKVWTTYLRQASNWVIGRGNIPRGGFPPTTSHLLLTRQTIQRLGDISSWFTQVINRIAQENGENPGNLYKFAGEVCKDLYSKAELSGNLRTGWLPANFSGGDHKRFWMFMMFLRRDDSIIKCLFTKALIRHPDGRQTLKYWYDPSYYNPNKCELPVDSHVLENWNNLFSRIGMRKNCGRSRKEVAIRARTIAQQHSISPSVFDALLFF